MQLSSHTTAHAGTLPDSELVLALTIKSLPHVVPAQGALTQLCPELGNQKAALQSKVESKFFNKKNIVHLEDCLG